MNFGSEVVETFDCLDCQRELPLAQGAYSTGCGIVCTECDNVDEAFAHLLFPLECEPVRVNIMKAAGGGYWVTTSECCDKRFEAHALTALRRTGATARHPHYWPYASWPGERGMWMNYDDRATLGLCQERE